MGHAVNANKKTHTQNHIHTHTRTHIRGTHTPTRMHTLTRTHARARTHTHIHNHSHTPHTQTLTRTHARTHTHTHTYTRARTHTHTYTHSRTHTHMHTQSHTHIHTLTHAYTHTHTHSQTHTNTLTNTQYVILITFPLQKLLHERDSVLRYNNIAYPFYINSTSKKSFYDTQIFFVVNFTHFSIIFNFWNFPYSFEIHFTIKNNTTFSASLTGLIFNEIWFCSAMRGVGHLTSNFVTQVHVVFILSQGWNY